MLINERILSKNLNICALVDIHYMSLIMRKPYFCLCENKGADQLCSNCTTDQHLCFHHLDCTILLLSKSNISSLYQSYVTVQSGLCRTWSELKLWPTVFSRIGSYKPKDFRKTLDLVDHELCFQELKHCKMTDLSFSWFDSYLNNRT